MRLAKTLGYFSFFTLFSLQMPSAALANSDIMVEVDSLCSKLQNSHDDPTEQKAVAALIVELFSQFKPEPNELENLQQQLMKHEQCFKDVHDLMSVHTTTTHTFKAGEFLIQNFTGKKVELALFHCKTEYTLWWGLKHTLCPKSLLSHYPHKEFPSTEKVKASDSDADLINQDPEIQSIENHGSVKFDILHPNYKNEWIYVTAYSDKEHCRTKTESKTHGKLAYKYKGTPLYKGDWGAIFRYNHPGWLEMGSAVRFQHLMTILPVEEDPCSFEIILH